jgi:hypothetical protein
MRTKNDATLAALQAKQLGLATTQQARAARISNGALRRAVASGALDRVRRGVLASPAAAPTFEQRVLAAVLAAGENAFASHETAAQLWELPLSGPAQLEVTTVIDRRPRTTGVRLHRSGLLVERDLSELGAIPLTVPERTIVDLSSRLSHSDLGRMIDDALRRRITTLGRIVATAERLPRAPGRSPKKLRGVLDARVPGVEERESVLEDFVFDALRRFGLPLPVCQYEIEINGKRRRIDLCFPDDRLALEALGFQWHGWRSRWDADVLRGNELVLAKFRVLQFTSAFTDRQIAQQVAEALGRRCRRAEGPDLTFAEWIARRDCVFGRKGPTNAPERSKHSSPRR